MVARKITSTLDRYNWQIYGLLRIGVDLVQWEISGSFRYFLRKFAVLGADPRVYSIQEYQRSSSTFSNHCNYETWYNYRPLIALNDASHFAETRYVCSFIKKKKKEENNVYQCTPTRYSTADVFGKFKLPEVYNEMRRNTRNIRDIRSTALAVTLGRRNKLLSI
jgi:hypothetical protein